jgi:Na+/H+-dicarboxylate symporter
MTVPKTIDHAQLSRRILWALALGLVVGLVLNATIAGVPWVRAWLLDGLFYVVGEVFIRLLSMLIVPIVFVSLVNGVASLSDPSQLGRVSVKALGLYLMTTGIAVCLALAGALIFQPGLGAAPVAVTPAAIADAPSFLQVLVNMVPRNPVASMAEGAMLPIIVFSILLGLSIAFAGEPGHRVASMFRDLDAVVMRLVGLVMALAPLGVFALTVRLGALTGWGAFLGVLKYVILVFAVLLVHAFVVYPSLLKLLSGLSPFTFLRKMRDPLAFAFSTASSGATIPVTLRTVIERLGAGKRVAAFTIPLGATINMDGTAIMQGIAVGFIAQYYGIELSLAQYALVVVMVILASVGTAGVPGVGLVMLAGVLTQVGLPVEGIALILGVDRLLDMTRTAVNVCGDAVVTCIVAKSEGELDAAVYNSAIEDDPPEPGPQPAP